MTTDLWITTGLALIGWTWAIAQFLYKRKWQKNDMLAARRYDAYSRYMRKCEEINENMRKDPHDIYRILNEFFVKSLEASAEEIPNVLANFNQQLFEYVKRSGDSLWIVNQELTPLLLIASPELSLKLKEQKQLITDFNNELQNCLNCVNIKDGTSFKALQTMGQDNRWPRFVSLTEEIIEVMRKEINIE